MSAFLQLKQRQILDVCIGFLRQHMSLGVDDISTIVVRYVCMTDVIHNRNYCHIYSNIKDEGYKCHFRIKTNDYIIDKHCGSPVIFGPFLSQILKKKKKKHAISNDHNDEAKNNSLLPLTNIQVCIEKNECNHKTYQNQNGYNFQCGLIAIPKKFFSSSDDLDVDDSSYNAGFEKIHTIMDSKPSYKFENCWLQHIYKMDKQFNEFKSYHYQWSYNTIEHSERFYINASKHGETSTFAHKNAVIEKISKYKDKINFNVYFDSKEKQYFAQCDPNYSKTKQMSLHFELAESSYANTIPLNFDQFDYLFAMASKRCDCDKNENVTGFEFSVVFK